jgi:hypothetical protein
MIKSKRVDRNLPSPYRSCSFTQADATTADIIDVDASLGRAAKNCTIEVDATGDGMSVRFNVQRTIYPRFPIREGYMYTEHLPYLCSGVNYTDETTALVNIEAGSTYEWESGPAIKDIQIVTQSGNWDIYLS